MKTFVKTGAIAFFVAICFGRVKGGEDIDTMLAKKYTNADSLMNKRFKAFEYESICVDLEQDLHGAKSTLNKFWCFYKNSDPKEISKQVDEMPKFLSILNCKKTYKAARNWAFEKVANSFDLVLLYQLVRLTVNEFSELAEAHPAIQEKHKREAMFILKWFVTLYPLYLAEIKIYADLYEKDKYKNLMTLKENLQHRFKINSIPEKVTFTELTKTVLTDLSFEKLYEKSAHRPGALYNAKNDSLISVWITFKNPPKDLLKILSGDEMRLAIANIRKQTVELYIKYMKQAKSWAELWAADTVIFKDTFGIKKSESSENFEELSVNELTKTLDSFEISDDVDWGYLEKSIFPAKKENIVKVNEIKNDIKIENVEKKEINEKKEIKKDEITEQNSKKKETEKKK